jgi:predicted nuclease with TOPRIM domain
MNPLEENQNINNIIPINSNKCNCNSPIHSKLVTNYNNLKVKYDKKVKENKMLKETLENIISAFNGIEENYKSTQTMYTQINEAMKTLLSKREEFSTSKSTNYVTRYEHNYNPSNPSTPNTTMRNSTVKMQEYVPEIQLSKTPSSIFYSRKLEELELCFHEMNKNYTHLVSKYKLLKEEKDKTEEQKIKLLQGYSELEKVYDETLKELYSRYDDLKRYKEIDKCLVDFTINSFVLKTDERSKIDNKDIKDKKETPPVIKCEPIPTFAKFLNKYIGTQK